MASDPLFGRITLLFMLVVFTVSLTLLNSFSRDDPLTSPEPVLPAELKAQDAAATDKKEPLNGANSRLENPPNGATTEIKSNGQQVSQPTPTASKPNRPLSTPSKAERPPPKAEKPPSKSDKTPSKAEKTPSKEDDSVMVKSNATDEEEEVEAEAPRLQSLSMNCYSGQCVLYGKLSIIISVQKELAALCDQCFAWARQRPDANFPPLRGYEAKSVSFRPAQSSKTYADRAIRAMLLDVILGIGFRVEELSMLPDEYEYIFVREADQV